MTDPQPEPSVIGRLWRRARRAVGPVARLGGRASERRDRLSPAADRDAMGGNFRGGM